MSHDLVIKNGTIVDGLLNKAFSGDLAISGDTISDVGKVDGSAKREIDADFFFVFGVFIDLHTHFDAQIGWDPQMTPSSWHGVTTALMGNCGVSFAPVRPEDKELLANLSLIHI